MKVALSVKNTSRAIKPIKDDIIIYDGEVWYITTKAELLKETNRLLEECQHTLEELKQENLDFKRDVARQLQDMNNLIYNLFQSKEGEE